MLKTLAIFLPIELFGLWLGMRLTSLIAPTSEGVSSGVGLFVYILIATAFILLLIKFFRKFLKVLEIFSIFFATEIFFEILFIDIPNPGLLALPLALLVVALRLIYPDNWISKDIAVVFSILGIGAFLGASLGIIAAFALLILLTIYDFIAVFKTKHMITMAKSIIKENLAFAMAIPERKREIHIGGGDLVMPIIVSTAIYREYGTLAALSSLLIGLLILAVVIAVFVEKKGKAIPALPPIAFGMILGLIPWLM